MWSRQAVSVTEKAEWSIFCFRGLVSCIMSNNSFGIALMKPGLRPFLNLQGASILCACVGALPLLSAGAHALTPSGEAVAVVQSTSASGPGGSRTLAASKPVYSGDRIETGGRGTAQIIFADNTRFVVGPNSSVVIDKYVYNASNSGTQVSIQLARGAFRFISGSGSKRDFRIATPSATLGIRGTAFDVAVGGRLGTGLLVFDGSVRMCNRSNGQCTVVNRGCNAAVVTSNGNLGTPNSSADRAALIQAAFPLARRQDGLQSMFRVDTRSCGLTIAPPNGGVRQINLSPAQGGVINRPPDNPPGVPDNQGGGLGAPGASNPNGRPGSANSNASERARSNPGNSGNSNAGGKGKGKSKGKNKD